MEQERVLKINIFSNKVKEVLTDEEYYKLDKEAKWPLKINAPDCNDDIESEIIDISG